MQSLRRSTYDAARGGRVGLEPVCALCVIVACMRTVAISALIALTALASVAVAYGPVPLPTERPEGKVPRASAVRAAGSYARGRAGVVSFAVVDTKGKLRGRDEGRRYPAASVVKAMLLAAEIRRLKHAGVGIDSNTDSLLRAMITRSDNAAADAIYGRVGDGGLFRVARRARMRRFTVAGHWGNAQITAADMARFYLGLRGNLVRTYRRFGLRLLAHVTELQRWGIPQGAGRGWRIWFKGGWRPAQEEETSGPVTHQAALLRHRTGARLALAILTEESPGTGGGFEAIAGIARRLLRPPPPGPGRWPAG